MNFCETILKGVYLVRTRPHVDNRGEFERVWCREEFSERGLTAEIAQANVSSNKSRGTVRGLHWQEAPHGEVKVVRCAKGAIYDVVVDIEPTSPSFGRWIAVTLRSGSNCMLYISKGFAHGFQTLVDDSEVNYLTSAPYVANAGRGARYDDPRLGIHWPLPVTALSDRDLSWPLLGNAERAPCAALAVAE